MKQICITLTDQQHEKLVNKLHEENQKNLEHGVLSGFSITLEESFPGVSCLIVEINGQLDLGDVEWKISDAN